MPILGRHGTLARFLRDPVAHMQALYGEYGTVAAFVKGSTEWIFAAGPEAGEAVLTNLDTFLPGALPFPVPEASALARLSFNLTTMAGEKHKQQRRTLLPVFHKRHIETYRDEMVAIVDDIISPWSLRPDEPVNVDAAMQRLSLLVASKILFGIDASDSANQFLRMMERWMEMSSSVLVSLLPFDRPGFPYRRFLNHNVRLEQAYKAMIAAKREHPPGSTDVLSLLLTMNDDGDALSDSELIGQTHILFTAGYETTAHGLSWTLFLLAQHPRVMADVLDELDAELAGAAPNVAQLRSLPVLERAIRESLRLFPPVYMLPRTTFEPYSIGPHPLPVGSNVLFSIYVTHRMPELFPEPLQFNPERWTDASPSPYAYLPFSGGSRLCLGAEFALMEMKIALAMILQRFRLTVVPGARISRNARATLALRHGLPMLVCPQDRDFRAVPIRGNVCEMVALS